MVLKPELVGAQPAEQVDDLFARHVPRRQPDGNIYDVPIQVVGAKRYALLPRT